MQGGRLIKLRAKLTERDVGLAQWQRLGLHASFHRAAMFFLVRKEAMYRRTAFSAS